MSSPISHFSLRAALIVIASALGSNAAASRLCELGVLDSASGNASVYNVELPSDDSDVAVAAAFEAAVVAWKAHGRDASFVPNPRRGPPPHRGGPQERCRGVEWVGAA